jgi:Ca2+-binding EF-hand superfamily protein
LIIGMIAAVAPGTAYSQARPAAKTPVRPAQPAGAQAVSVPRAAFIATMDAEFKQIEDFQRVVSVLAAQNRNRALFAALDKDHNGVLTPAEFAALPMQRAQPNAAPLLAQVDANRDGQITQVEFRSGKLANFDRMDTDKDGVVTAAEMRAAGLIKR